MNWRHLFELASMAVCLGLGVVICIALIVPLLNWHFRWQDDNPMWYE